MAKSTQVFVDLIARDKTRAAFKSAQTRLRKLTRSAITAGRKFQDALGLVPARGIAGLTAAIGFLGKAVFQTQLKFDSMRNSLRVATGSILGAELEIVKMQRFTKKLGIEFVSTASAYRQFVIASKEAGFAAKTSDEIFESVSLSAAAMGLSAESTRLTLKALEQMISKGNVQAEELRGQLGEHLPGAFGMASEAMGVTTQQFNKMMERGEILATDLLPRLAKVLRDRFGKVAVDAAEQPRASLNRLMNAWTMLKERIASSGVGKLIARIMDSITAKLENITENLDEFALKFLKTVRIVARASLSMLRPIVNFANRFVETSDDIDERMKNLSWTIRHTERTIKDLKGTTVDLANETGSSMSRAADSFKGIFGQDAQSQLKTQQKLLAEFNKQLAELKEQRVVAGFFDFDEAAINKSIDDTIGIMENAIKTSATKHNIIGEAFDFQQALKAGGGVAALQAKMGDLGKQLADGLISEELYIEKAVMINDVFDEFMLKPINTKVAEVADEIDKKLVKAAEQFGKTMTAGLASSIVEGRTLNDILGDMSKRLAEMIIQKKVVGPLAGALSGEFSKGEGGMFGGFFANGGRPPLGKVSMVGENGPELFVPDRSGTIIPNGAGGAGGGITINQTIDARGADEGVAIRIEQAAADGAQQAVSAVTQDFATNGNLRRMLGV